MTHPIETFFAAWGETDPVARAATLRSCVSDNLHYADPRTAEAITDVDALIGYVGMYTQYAPGATAGVVRMDETGGQTRATVEFRMGDGATQLGQYFIETDNQSRPARMTGFAGLGAPE